MDNFLGENDKTIALKNVYMHLEDNLSKEIYFARSLFSLSDDRRNMRNVIRKMPVSKLMLNEIKNHAKCKKVLFGAGTWGDAICSNFEEILWDYVVDNNKVGQMFHGKKIVSLDNVENIDECYFVIAVLFAFREIKEQLLKLGIPESRILVLGEITEERQYFDLDALKLGDNEVFIDAGGFDGNTSIQFIKQTNEKFDSIILFEPSQELAKACKRNLSRFQNVRIIEKGTWDCTDNLYFSENQEESRISENNTNAIKIETTTIDDVLAGGKATYIKMDIEGAEIKSIVGAENTIRKYRPKLAISVYHKRDDIWEIPVLLLKYNPEYKFYLRTYSFTGNDTVLYAI